MFLELVHGDLVKGFLAGLQLNTKLLLNQTADIALNSTNEDRIELADANSCVSIRL